MERLICQFENQQGQKCISSYQIEQYEDIKVEMNRIDKGILSVNPVSQLSEQEFNYQIS